MPSTHTPRPALDLGFSPWGRGSAGGGCQHPTGMERSFHSLLHSRGVSQRQVPRAPRLQVTQIPGKLHKQNQKGRWESSPLLAGGLPLARPAWLGPLTGAGQPTEGGLNRSWSWSEGWGRGGGASGAQWGETKARRCLGGWPGGASAGVGGGDLAGSCRRKCANASAEEKPIP